MKLIFKRLASSQLLSLLENKPYLWFILSVACTQMAINMANVVAILLVHHLTSSSFLVSLLVLSFMVPQILLSFVGGIVADLRNKRKILFFGNIARAILFIVLFLNTKSLLIIYIISFLVSIITQFYIPAETPLIPKFVRTKLLIAANSLFSIALFGSILIGYVIAGPLIEILGRSEIFLFIGGIFALAAFGIYKIPMGYFESKKQNTGAHTISYSITHEFKKTYDILLNARRAVGPFFLLTFSQVIILMLATIIPEYAKSILEIKAEDATPLLFGPAALGMMITALLIGGIWNKADKSRLMTIGLIGSGIVFFLFPFTTKIVTRQIVTTLNSYLPHLLDITPPHLAFTLSLLAGISNALLFIPSQAIIQEVIPENFRSKVYGLLFGMIGVLSLVPILLTGELTDSIGVGNVLFLLGATIIIIGLIRAGLIGLIWKK